MPGSTSRRKALSPETRAVLIALAAQPQVWRHGYDLCKETAVASGTLYPLLIRLSDRGLLEAEWRPAAQPGRPARHVYRLTAEGLAIARERALEAPARAAPAKPAPAAA